MVLGSDVAGTVEDVGASVTRFCRGDGSSASSASRGGPDHRGAKLVVSSTEPMRRSTTIAEEVDGSVIAAGPRLAEQRGDAHR